MYLAQITLAALLCFLLVEGQSYGQQYDKSIGGGSYGQGAPVNYQPVGYPSYSRPVGGQGVVKYPGTYPSQVPGQYLRPGQYPSPGQYPRPGQYPSPGQYPGTYPGGSGQYPGQLPRPGQYPSPGVIPRPGQYPSPGVISKPGQYPSYGRGHGVQGSPVGYPGAQQDPIGPVKEDFA